MNPATPTTTPHCDACRTTIHENDRTFKCNFCLKCYHQDCLGSPVQRDKLACPNCARMSRTPLRQESMVTMTDEPQAEKQPSFVSERSKQRKLTVKNLESTASQPVEDGSLAQEIRLFREDMAGVKHQLTELTSTVSKYQVKLEDLVGRIINTETRLTKMEEKETEHSVLKEKVQRLERVLKSREETIAQLQLDSSIQAQNHLGNEIEISGIAEVTGENLHHIVLLTAKKIGVELSETDIDWTTRVGPRQSNTTSQADGGVTVGNRSRPIVVRLTRRAMRDQMLSGAKSRRGITSADIVKGNPNKIYFNERLTKANRDLFRVSRATATEKGFKYCWVRNGRIHVRKADNKPAIHVRSFEELEQLPKYTTSATAKDQGPIETYS